MKKKKEEKERRKNIKNEELFKTYENYLITTNISHIQE